MLFYGGDYNPEQWPEAVWREDVALMREARVNLVSLGVFSWSRLEPAEGRYDFGWLDRRLDHLADNGIRAALGTATASPPPWFSLAHPEALTVTAQGVRLSHGSRDTYCPSAPAYRTAAVRLAEALATHFAGHPGLALWHVHNEYGTGCHCDLAAEAFRGWLRERYGSLAALNEAWTAAFWSQDYTDWAQVQPPRATQYLSNPTQVLDFRRFTSDELLACFREQRAVLRAHTPDTPVTTNFAFGGWVPVDHWAWAAEVDLVAIDCYPSAPGRAGAAEVAFAADLARAWGGDRGWLLMEQAANLTFADGRMLAKPPAEMIRQSLSHVARGSRGAMFFQWRAPRGGAEMFHAAMVPHAGADSRVFRGVVELGTVLSGLSATAPAPAAVAVLWDAQSWWALSGPGLPSTDLDYLAQVQGVHGALWRGGIATDFAHPEGDLAGYRVVLVPALFLLTAAAAENLRAYVHSGGTLVVWFASGIVDRELRVGLGGYPAALRDVLGIRVEEFQPLPPGSVVPLSTGDTGRGWREYLHLAGAQARASYPDGTPAITHHRYGAGAAWYVSTDLDEGGLDRLVAGLDLAPVRPDLPPGVEAIASGGNLFLLNHTDAEVLDLPPGGYRIDRP